MPQQDSHFLRQFLRDGGIQGILRQVEFGLVHTVQSVHTVHTVHTVQSVHTVHTVKSVHIAVPPGAGFGDSAQHGPGPGRAQRGTSGRFVQ